MVTGENNVAGGGALFQCQALGKEQFDSAVSESPRFLQGVKFLNYLIFINFTP